MNDRHYIKFREPICRVGQKITFFETFKSFSRSLIYITFVGPYGTEGFRFILTKLGTYTY